MKSILPSICAMTLLTETVAFLNPTQTQRVQSSGIPSIVLSAEAETASESSSATKSICSFDESDFSGRTSWPYTAADLNRLDNSDDSNFYTDPRLVTHIDDTAIQSLTDYYRESFEEFAAGSEEPVTIDILDMCSSWISHLPTVDSDSKFRYGNVVGLGMNQAELDENKQLTSNIVQDLNVSPKTASLEDNSFDFVTMTVSIDYLIKPLEIVQEIQRVLKPKGSALISFGNRCFPTKAVAMWLQADDIERITIVASYFHYAQYDQGDNMDGGDDINDGNDEQLFQWKSIEAFDLKEEPKELPTKPSMGELMSNPTLGVAWMNAAAAIQKANQSDPLFVIKATKE
eukprot:CAMPEP_0116119150 /NCGR_PEP_ID=MMETSP0329-20121206/2484_1 /TAXON_ID=697910 /ORGANISM="Pseudo-nitzschia arenysensis, Strain B593" /LENGTH=343 /DNA_ID=CAMNT_0003612825 /DNA_START=23 /DNA_END=1054 /DNA_ORIENTATION=-